MDDIDMHINNIHSNLSKEMPEYCYVAQEEEDDDDEQQEFQIQMRLSPFQNSHHSIANNDINNYNININTSTSTSTTINNNDDDNNWQRKYTLFLYAITTVLLFADQNLLAPNLSAAANEFGFDNDTRDKKLGGDIALAFFLLGAPASFLVGCAADSDYFPRSLLFGLTVIIGEGACFLTYFTTTYTGLYITRALTGFSVGGALPLLSSVLGDWFPPQERSKVMASVGVGTGIGIAVGQGLAGFMGPQYGWRSPFLVVSTPALFVGILVITTVKDPKRGASEIVMNHNLHHHQNQNFNVHLDIQQHPNYNQSQNIEEQSYNKESGNTNTIFNDNNEFRSSQSTELYNSQTAEAQPHNSNDDEIHTIHDHNHNNENNGIKRKVTYHSFIQSLLSWINPKSYASHLKTTKELFQTKTVVLTMIQGAPGCVPWGIVNTFLNDYLSEDCGLSVQQATTMILLFGFGNGIGMITGGTVGDYLHKKDTRYPVLFSGSMAMLGCIPLWILVNTTNVVNEEITMMMAIKTGLISLLGGVGSGVTGPIVKATLQNVTLPNARGQAFALLNTFDDFGRGLGPVYVAALIVALGGRQQAFNLGIAGWVFCGVFNCCMYWTIQSDEESIKAKLSMSSSSLQDPQDAEEC